MTDNLSPFPVKVSAVLPVAILILILIVVGLGFWTALYTIPAESEGVILRFGRFSDTVSPGLHFKLPLGVDKVEVVSVRRQLKQEFGFGTTESTNPWQSSPQSEWNDEKAMVTGDLNAALVEWVIQYRIEKPDHYLFNVRNPDANLRDCSESVMREVVGDRTVDEVITIGRQEIEDEALQKLQALAAGYDLLLDVLAWRAHEDFVRALGYPDSEVERINELAVGWMRSFARRWQHETPGKAWR